MSTLVISAHVASGVPATVADDDSAPPIRAAERGIACDTGTFFTTGAPGGHRDRNTGERDGLVSDRMVAQVRSRVAPASPVVISTQSLMMWAPVETQMFFVLM